MHVRCCGLQQTYFSAATDTAAPVLEQAAARSAAARTLVERCPSAELRTEFRIYRRWSMQRLSALAAKCLAVMGNAGQLQPEGGSPIARSQTNPLFALPSGSSGRGTAAMAALAALTSRLNTVLARLSQLELEVGVTPADAVAARQLAVLDRIARLEAACGLAAAATAPALPLAAASPAPLPLSAGAALLPEVKEVDRSGSEVQQRLQAELLELGLTRHKFVRVSTVAGCAFAVANALRSAALACCAVGDG